MGADVILGTFNLFIEFFVGKQYKTQTAFQGRVFLRVLKHFRKVLLTLEKSLFGFLDFFPDNRTPSC